MAIPDVEILAVLLFTIMALIYSSCGTTCMVQEVRLEGIWSLYRGLNVVRSCSMFPRAYSPVRNCAVHMQLYSRV